MLTLIQFGMKIGLNLPASGSLAGAQVVKGVVQLISPICMAFLIRAAPFFTSSFTIRFSR